MMQKYHSKLDGYAEYHDTYHGTFGVFSYGLLEKLDKCFLVKIDRDSLIDTFWDHTRRVRRQIIDTFWDHTRRVQRRQRIDTFWDHTRRVRRQRIDTF